MKELFILDDIRTNNFNDSHIEEKIESLWDNVNSKLGSNFSDKKYAIYSEYESNYKGDYTLAIATKTIQTPEVVNIPDSKYQQFEVKDGDLYKTWKEIWLLEDEGKIERAYTLDYEVYDEDDINIFIAIK